MLLSLYEWHRSVQNSSPIWHALMAVISDFLQYCECKAKETTLNENFQIKSFKLYADDSNIRVKSDKNGTKFLTILNKRYNDLEYTMETEHEEKFITSLALPTPIVNTAISSSNCMTVSAI